LKTTVVFLFGTAGIVTVALFAQIYSGEVELSGHAAVVTDHHQCTNIGMDILKRGGTATDAAVAATLCMGVVHFHVTGLGGYVYFHNFLQLNKNDRYLHR